MSASLTPPTLTLRRSSSTQFDPPTSNIPPVQTRVPRSKPADTPSPTVLLSPTTFGQLSPSSNTDIHTSSSNASAFSSNEPLSQWTKRDLSSVSICCVSGGTGGNAICSSFGPLTKFILPISDDGGSSSEILRVLGGPSIGDIRSRLVRLAAAAAPQSSSSGHLDGLERGERREGDREGDEAVLRLLSHRIPWDVSDRQAKDLWREVVEGSSELWDGVPSERREIIHKFLVIFESEILQRAHKAFSFRNASLGNIFLCSAQRFFLSLPAAIHLFSSVTQSLGRYSVIPAILTNHTATIAAELNNGQTIVGQCNISHPASTNTTSATQLNTKHSSNLEPILNPNDPSSSSSHLPSPSPTTQPTRPVTPSPPIRRLPFSFAHSDGLSAPASRLRTEQAASEAAASDGGLRSSTGMAVGNLVFTKDDDEKEEEEERRAGEGKGEVEEGGIRRLSYINVYGQEIFPIPNPEYLSSLSTAEMLVLSCGSLWTSIVPCLALQSIGSAIANSPSLKAKVLLLNSTNDRETRGYSALDYLHSIVRTLNHYDVPSSPFSLHASASASSTTHQPNHQPFHFSSSSSDPDTQTKNIKDDSRPSPPRYRLQPHHLISHIVVLQGSNVKVDVPAIEALEIKVISIPASSSRSSFASPSLKVRFDASNVKVGLEEVLRSL